MSAQNNGGPAFPTIEGCYEQKYAGEGMSLRDYFAAKSLQGCMAYFNESRGDFHTNAQPDEVAKYCYQVADAMLFARDQS